MKYIVIYICNTYNYILKSCVLFINRVCERFCEQSDLRHCPVKSVCGKPSQD
uniref:Uncharacterized protein n=1 Tax=Anguilla anguilla TaxID=7936 RepID=A0A0E9QJ92_ANGAN